MIEPRILKGFRDSLPQQELIRQELTEKVKEIFRSFGFVPIDTPAIEYTEVLLGKGGGETDKQMFRFTDNGGRDVSLRFDLTVPLARFTAANYSKLAFPFKRYHIGKVWRGEKPQKGRFREFTQCDFDIIGADNVQSDFEILLLIHTCLSGMGIGAFKVLVSHRGLINRLLETNSIEGSTAGILRAVDKLSKAGKDAVERELLEQGLCAANVRKIMDFTELPKDSFEETLILLEKDFCSNGAECEEITRLKGLLDLMKACSIEKDFVLDTSITRGLDYYTGIVFETTLLELPEIGSICSGGRYNNLTGLYTKEKLPGVGSCIGLDRLIAALEETNSPLLKNTRCADVLVVCTENTVQWAQTAAQELRNAGLMADCYLGSKGQGQQFAYAETKDIPYAVFSGQDGSFSVKEISSRKVFENLTAGQIAKLVKARC